MEKDNANLNDFPVTIAVGKSRLSNDFPAYTVSFRQFATKATNHIRTPETAKEYAEMSGRDRSAIKDVGGFVAGTFRDGKRSLDNLETRTMITLDLDNGRYSPDELILHVYNSLGRPAMLGYSTHSHTVSLPRIRVVIPLAKPATPRQYEFIASAVVARCGLAPFTDDCSTRPAQLFYWPSASKDAAVWWRHLDGEPLDVEKLSLPMQTDAPERPPKKHPAVATEQPMSAKTDFPYTPGSLSGWEGAFCRVYNPIDKAIEKYLHSIYIPETQGRYRFAGADSEGGLVVLPDGQHVYSHHTNTDPAADGRPHNAYDLVKIHIAAGNDIVMQHLCSADPDVMKELRKVKELVLKTIGQCGFVADDPDSLDFLPAGDLIGEIPGLELNQFGAPKPTVDNICRILTRDEALKDGISFDIMSRRTYADSKLPWFKMVHPYCDADRDFWSDADHYALLSYLSKHYRIDNDPKVAAAVHSVKLRHTFHPVRDYLESLSWDGEPRLDTMIINYLGAEDDPCTRQMTELMMVGAVARVYEPGVKFDYLTVLQGRQGTFKSTLCRTLFSPWCCDSFDLDDGKDGLLKLRCNWGIEFAELAGLRKAEIEAVKKFVTLQHDEYRDPYARNNEVYPRQCIFIGTTNDVYFLTDDENRRFCVIPIDAKLRKYADPANALQNDKDQLWAEALHRYKTVWKGRPLVLSAANAEEQHRRNKGVHISRIDPLRTDLEDYLSRPLPYNWETLNPDQRYGYYHTNTHSVDEMQDWPERKTFSVRAFLREYYGYSSEAEAKSRNRALRGNLGRKIAEYLPEFGIWSEPKQAYTIYGRAWQYDRLLG